MKELDFLVGLKQVQELISMWVMSPWDKDFLHKQNQFPCSICDFKTKCKLKTQIESLHDGTKYP